MHYHIQALSWQNICYIYHVYYIYLQITRYKQEYEQVQYISHDELKSIIIERISVMLLPYPTYVQYIATCRDKHNKAAVKCKRQIEKGKAETR